MTFLALLWKSELFRKALGFLAGFLVVWYIVHSYNSWVTEEALDANDAEWTVKLTAEKAKLTDYVAGQEVARATAIADALKRAKEAEEKYAKLKLEAAKLSALRDSTRSPNVGVRLDAVTSSASAQGDLGESCRRSIRGLSAALRASEQRFESAMGIASSESERARSAASAAQALSAPK
jgi:hypothetical protein